MTASCKASLAPSRPDTSSQLTLGFSVTIASERAPSNLDSSSSPSYLPVFFFEAAAPPPPPPAGGSGLLILSFLG